MPKHPTSPPYKSSLAISKSKDIQKYMTTIPKPIIISKWQSWNMKRLKDNKLQWYPSEYGDILNHLITQWKEISVRTLEAMKDNERMLFHVIYNTNNDITSANSWEISVRELKLKPFKKWKWIYDSKKPEYLVYVMQKWVNEDITSSKSLEGMKDIIELALKILLANSQ